MRSDFREGVAFGVGLGVGLLVVLGVLLGAIAVADAAADAVEDCESASYHVEMVDGRLVLHLADEPDSWVCDAVRLLSLSWESAGDRP